MSENVYSEEFYDAQQRGSLRSARVVLALLFKHWLPQSVVDVGCGLGTWLNACKELGVSTVIGMDGSWVPQERLAISPEEFRRTDLRSPFHIGRKVDLAMSLEVAEHLPPECSDTFVESLSNLSDAVLFGAAFLGQPGTDHINTQLHSFWAARFASRGYAIYDLFRPQLWSDETVEPWYRQNTFLYVRPSHPLADLLARAQVHPLPSIGFVDCVHPWLYRAMLGKAEGEEARALALEARLRTTMAETFKAGTSRLAQKLASAFSFRRSPHETNRSSPAGTKVTEADELLKVSRSIASSVAVLARKVQRLEKKAGLRERVDQDSGPTEPR